MNEHVASITVTLAAIAAIIFLTLGGKRKPGVSAPVPAVPNGPVAGSPDLYYNVPLTRGGPLPVPAIGGGGGFFDESFSGAYPQGF